MAAPKEPASDQPTAEAPHLIMQNMRESLWSPAPSEPETPAGISRAQGVRRTDTVATTSSTFTIPPIPDVLRPGIVPPGVDFEGDESNPWSTMTQVPEIPQIPARFAPQPPPTAPTPQPESAPEPEFESVNESRPGSRSQPTVDVPQALKPGPIKRKPVSPGTTPTSTGTPTMPVSAPPPPPTNAFAQMNLQGPAPPTNPWQPDLDAAAASKKSTVPASLVPGGEEESARRARSSDSPFEQPSRSSPSVATLPTSEERPAWSEDRNPPNSLLEQNDWDDLGYGSGSTSLFTVSQAPPQPHSPDEWDLIDPTPDRGHPNNRLSRQDSWENFQDDDDHEEGVQSVAPSTAPDHTQHAPAATHGPDNTFIQASPPAPVSSESRPAEPLQQLPPIPQSDPFPEVVPASRAEPAPQPSSEPAAAPLALPSLLDTPSEPSPAVAAPAAPAVSIQEPTSRASPSRDTSSPQAPPQPPRAQPKSETYQIKNINWFDASIKNIRKTPTLIQNANGPCPLVALVNALTLTTPVGVNSNLVETLKTREQVSLDFLLEAVFDELMSPRRSNPDKELPDLTELYGFMKGLQTGMNVNPRFVSDAAEPSAGGFEETRDLKLYSTFSIPLIHGWIPRRDDYVVEAFRRQASSYDEVQNLLFREEELDMKLSTTETGLTEQEQQLYQDILTLKAWLSSSATQLTPFGLDLVAKSIQPGAVAILFRNDHFSTLYRNPESRQLFTLVTDAGYHKHDEVIWESLADVSGERAEFFSGDFRPVGGPNGMHQGGSQSERGASQDSRGGEWQTVQGRRAAPSNRQSEANANDDVSSPLEQEDRDLALALQLQEEEDERHRADQAARRQESQLSENFIETQGRRGSGARGSIHSRTNSMGRGGAPALPARTSSTPAAAGSARATGQRRATQGQHVSPLVPPANRTHRPADESGEEVPPTYEQASRSRPYVPQPGHPNHPSSTPTSAMENRRRSSATATSPQNPRQDGTGPALPQRPPRQYFSQMTPAANLAGANATNGRDCVLM